MPFKISEQAGRKDGMGIPVSACLGTVMKYILFRDSSLF